MPENISTIKLPGFRTEICVSVLAELYRRGGASKSPALMLPYDLGRKLAAAGFLDSRRGVHGGIMLRSDFYDKTVWDLVVAVEPELSARSESSRLLQFSIERVLRNTKITDLFPEDLIDAGFRADPSVSEY
jgi:hypothetical protein